VSDRPQKAPSKLKVANLPGKDQTLFMTQNANFHSRPNANSHAIAGIAKQARGQTAAQKPAWFGQFATF
jgi:hypothetical protein